MAWVLLDDDFPNHPKTLKANKAARSAGYVFVCGLCYCRKYHTGGFIAMEAWSRLGATTAVITALVDSGLWHRHDGGMQVNGYDGLYADEDAKAMKETIRAERRSAGRKGGIESGKIRAQDTHGASILLEARIGSDRSGDSDHLLEEKKREADFAAFWNRYPRRDGKQGAKTEWMRLKPTDDEQRVMAADLERRSQSAQWLKDSGQFIPHARTYLHQKRWEDGFVETPRLSEKTINVLKGFEEPHHDVSGVQTPRDAAGGATWDGIRPADVEVVSPSDCRHPVTAPGRRH